MEKPQAVVLTSSALAFGPRSARVTCPNCRASILTRVEYEASAKTHIIALLLCGLCCCCIPYCVDSCQNANHYCPNCHTFLGAYK